MLIFYHLYNSNRSNLNKFYLYHFKIQINLYNLCITPFNFYLTDFLITLIDNLILINYTRQTLIEFENQILIVNFDILSLSTLFNLIYDNRIKCIFLNISNKLNADMAI